MKLLTPPNNYVMPKLAFWKHKDASIFLAGSIDNGKAEDWQTKVIDRLKDLDNVVVFNPRRPDWNTALEPVMENPEFAAQVQWEHDHLMMADTILFYFAEGSVSPITLLELGLCAPMGNCYVVCHSSFWRKGNVEFICGEYDIPLYDNVWLALDDILADCVW